MAIGFQGNYFGIGIKGNIATRNYEISIVNGDDFDMKGWFVANGVGGTPACIDRFSRYAIASGGLGGSNDAVVVQHNHGASAVAGGGHLHAIKKAGSGPVAGAVSAGAASQESVFGWNSDSIGDHNHGITVNNEGVSGVNANRPAYIDAIPIIRMS